MRRGPDDGYPTGWAKVLSTCYGAPEIGAEQTARVFEPYLLRRNVPMEKAASHADRAIAVDDFVEVCGNLQLDTPAVTRDFESGWH